MIMAYNNVGKKMTVGDLAQLLNGYDILTIYQNETMVYDELVKDLQTFLDEEITRIKILGYKQLAVEI